jgi:hypothetical protein
MLSSFMHDSGEDRGADETPPIAAGHGPSGVGRDRLRIAVATTDGQTGKARVVMIARGEPGQ